MWATRDTTILAVASVNLGNPALCLSLPGCGPFGEDNTYTDATGQTIYGTRTGQNSLDHSWDKAKTTARIPPTAPSPTPTTTRSKPRFAISATARSSCSAIPTRSRSIRAPTSASSSIRSIRDRAAPSPPGTRGRPSSPATPWALPIANSRTASASSNRLTDDWSLSGTTRFATGFPVTLYDNSDNSLLGTLGNGVNNYLLDTPQYLPGPLKINTNGRNGKPAFNTALFPEENLGQLGNAKRRIFYGPGINNFDLTLQKNVRLAESKSLEFRVEAFNAFNHAQFYGPASVDGQVEDPNFGQIVSAAAPRLLQLVAKFNF